MVLYLDDGVIAGNREEVLEALDMINFKAKERGLNLNFSKCEVAFLGVDAEEINPILSIFDGVAPGIQLISPEKALLLGAALSPESRRTIINEKVSMLDLFLHRLYSIPSHSAFNLLMSSLYMPQL